MGRGSTSARRAARCTTSVARWRSSSTPPSSTAGRHNLERGPEPEMERPRREKPAQACGGHRCHDAAGPHPQYNGFTMSIVGPFGFSCIRAWSPLDLLGFLRPNLGFSIGYSCPNENYFHPLPSGSVEARAVSLPVQRKALSFPSSHFVLIARSDARQKENIQETL